MIHNYKIFRYLMIKYSAITFSYGRYIVSSK